MLLTHRSPLYALHLRASLVLGCLSLRHIISTDRFDQIFLTESRTLLASKRNNQCKPLAARKDVTINQLNQTIAQLNLSNQRKCSCQSTRGATPSPDSRARLVETIKSNQVTTKATVNSLNKEHYVQLDALNLERKRFTESKQRNVSSQSV
jgi:hypothetical protein